jgi:hypothetical protein
MHVDLRGKVLVSVVGALVVLGLFLFSWVLGLLAGLILLPFYVKVLTA